MSCIVRAGRTDYFVTGIYRLRGWNRSDVIALTKNRACFPSCRHPDYNECHSENIRTPLLASYLFATQFRDHDRRREAAIPANSSGVVDEKDA